jgi:biotin--protein ligase
MKKILFAVFILISSSIIVSSMPSKSTKIADVLIYNDSGVWNDGVIAFEQFLECKELTFFECSDSYIENNELVDNFDVIFFPGGDFTIYANQINSVGLQHIRDFINAGGGYLGICGGGYFACDQVSWRGQSLDMPLDLFNGSGYGPIDEIAPYSQYVMTSITMNESNPINQYEPPTESIGYYGGAAFYPYEGQEIEMIGSYDSYNDDTAILDFHYGDGRVLLCGPHPEIEEDSTRDDVSFADELFDLGTDWNILWTCMDWLMGLSISEPPAPLPPYTPEIDGPGSGTAGTEYDYTFHVEDPEEEEVYYLIDWGDDSNSEWLGPYNSGEAIILSHIWQEEDAYMLRCKAKDAIGGTSEWATLEVSMPRNKPFNCNFNLLEWLFEWFPNAFPILRNLFGY